MSDHRGPSLTRRALSLLICYGLALQAFLAAYGTAFAISTATATSNGAAIICHGGGDPSPSPGEGGQAKVLSCALCAVATAGGLLIPEGLSVTSPAATAAVALEPADHAADLTKRSPRAGLSRAPPGIVAMTDFITRGA